MSIIVKKLLELSNFKRAWLKVKRNKGSAGVDGETVSDFARNHNLKLRKLKDSVANNTYQVRAYKQVFIPKKNGKVRELRIPVVRDRIVQQALLSVLSPLIEPTFSASSFAYRPDRSYLQAVEQIADWRDRGYVWVFDADIVKYFDNINRKILLRQVREKINDPKVLCLIKAWIFSVVLTKKGLEYPPK